MWLYYTSTRARTTYMRRWNPTSLSALSKHHYVFSQRYTISLTGLARQRSLVSGSVPEDIKQTECTCVFQQ